MTKKKIILLTTLLIAAIITAALTTPNLSKPKQQPTPDPLQTLSILIAASEDVTAYYEQVSNIPTSLTTPHFLANPAVTRQTQWQPHLNTTFTYQRDGNITYRLCANFPTTPTQNDLKNAGTPYTHFNFKNLTGNLCFSIGAAPSTTEPTYRAIPQTN